MTTEIVNLTLVSTADAAAVLGVSVATLNQWAVNGRIRTAVKTPGIRGARLFAEDDVMALAASRLREAAK